MTNPLLNPFAIIGLCLISALCIFIGIFVDPNKGIQASIILIPFWALGFVAGYFARLYEVGK